MKLLLVKKFIPVKIKNIENRVKNNILSFLENSLKFYIKNQIVFNPNVLITFIVYTYISNDSTIIFTYYVKTGKLY